MNLTPSWHSSNSKFLLSQSIQLQLTPKSGQVQQFEQSGSMISLSNYLQKDDSTICIEDNYTNSKYLRQNNRNVSQNNLIIKKQHLGCRFFQKSNQYRNHQNPLKVHYQQQQNSQSFLLLDSQIKQTPSQLYQRNIPINQLQQYTPTILDENISKQVTLFRQIQHEQSRIQTDLMCRFGESMELLDLLAISKSNQEVIEQRFNNKQQYQQLENQQKYNGNGKNALQNKKQNEQITKLKTMYLQLMNSNEQLIKRMNDLNINPNQSSNKNTIESAKCTKIQFQQKKLVQKLQQKERQIKKYQKMIQELNQTIFDLKMNNKKLQFQNQQYVQHIDRLYGQNNRFGYNEYNHQNLTFRSLDKPIHYKDCQNYQQQLNSFYQQQTSLSQRLEQQDDDNVYSSHPQIKNQQNLYNKQQDQYFNFQNDHASNYCQIKVYPQTPNPISNYNKKKKPHHQRKMSNNSDKLALSQLKQPSFYQIAQTKANKIIKQQQFNEQFGLNVIPTQKYLDSKINHHNQNYKSQKNLKRFSDLSNQILQHKANDFNKNIAISADRKSPNKLKAFLKVKTKQQLPKQRNTNEQISKPDNKNLINKKNNDNDSQSSQTKTQKTQKVKNKISPDEHDFLNKINKLGKRTCSHRVMNSQDQIRKSSYYQNNIQTMNKKPITYKSFKQIGTVFQKNQIQNNNQEIMPNIILNCQIKDYGFQQNQQKNTLKQYPKAQKSQRFYSPSPHSNQYKRDNHNYAPQISSPYLKKKQKKAQFFMR